ncbi:hypothetical protein HZH66_009805 [Vespula vulgaris]|uniref:Uncharacterized protein n=1 Tax=Vespula vulgaris TaxID=7454 RepID=A0A834N0I5_VESVU|nr:hypothetical protein HZH66_009805 [Vespula vulgaris]
MRQQYIIRVHPTLFALGFNNDTAELLTDWIMISSSSSASSRETSEDQSARSSLQERLDELRNAHTKCRRVGRVKKQWNPKVARATSVRAVRKVQSKKERYRSLRALRNMEKL